MCLFRPSPVGALPQLSLADVSLAWLSAVAVEAREIAWSQGLVLRRMFKFQWRERIREQEMSGVILGYRGRK